MDAGGPEQDAKIFHAFYSFCKFSRIYDVRVFTKYSFSIETLEPVESVYFDYPDTSSVAYCCGSSAPSTETTLQQQQAQESQALQNDFNKQFGEQQNFVQNFLKPQLESMYLNPTGFGATALADLDANLVNTTGAQAANARQAANASFATNNMAGLPSGVEQAIQSQINSAAGNTVASGKTQIQLANQQYKNQQQMTALSGLQNIPGMLGAAPQVGGLLTGANQAAFGEAKTIYDQNQAGNFWGNLGQGLLGGAINAGAGILTGGLSNILQGNPFMGPQAQAPTDTSWMPSNATMGQPYYPGGAPTGPSGVFGSVPGAVT
jgi:hypothetical protein